MPFVLSADVLPEDIDELGHTSNLVYLRWVVEAAVAHASAVGLGPEEYRARGQIFVVRRHEIEYLRSAVLGDRILAETRVVTFQAATSERQTVIRRASDGVMLACARTRYALIEKATGLPVRIPDDLRALLPAEALDPSSLRYWGGSLAGPVAPSDTTSSSASR